MRPAIKKVYQLTKEIDELLTNAKKSNNREDLIESINRLIEQREQYIQQVIPPYTENEKVTGQAIVKLNERISEAMTQLQKDIQLEIKQMKKTKQSSESYINPYKNIRMVDGMYLDQKK